jgi:hypothetical protein
MRGNDGTSHTGGARSLWPGGVMLSIGVFCSAASVLLANNRHSPTTEPRC